MEKIFFSHLVHDLSSPQAELVLLDIHCDEFVIFLLYYAFGGVPVDPFCLFVSLLAQASVMHMYMDCLHCSSFITVTTLLLPVMFFILIAYDVI